MFTNVFLTKSDHSLETRLGEVGTHKGQFVGVESSGINSKGEAWPRLGLNKLITNVLRMSVCLVCSLEESCTCTWGLLLQPHLPNE